MVKIMTRLTKTIAKEEMLGKVMARVATMNKDELGKLYDQLFGDVVEEPKNKVKEEPKAKVKESKKDEEHYVEVNGVTLKQISQKKDGFNRALYEAHARALGLFLAGKGRKGNGKVSGKDRMRVYQSMWYDYDPTFKMHK